MRLSTILLASAVTLLTALVSSAQTSSENLANSVVAARQKNAAMMRQYNWNCRTEVLRNGRMEDLRIDLVSIGADGQPQRTLLNDQPGRLPGGFLRRAIAQGQQKQAEQAAHGLMKLLDEYTLPSAGKVIAFIVQAQIQTITAPGGGTQLQVTGSDVVTPGDTFTMTLNPGTMQPVSVEISTMFNSESATLSATFLTLPSGLNILQYATAEMPSQGLKVLMHNYDVSPLN